MGLGGVISNLLSLGAKLLPVVNDCAQAPSSSSSSPVQGQQVEGELKQLIKLLERIKAILYDAEGREIMERSVKLWLEELREVAYDAEDVLDEYRYEVLRTQAEARHASRSDSLKMKHITLPDGMYDRIKQIKDRFDEIGKHRVALRLSDKDAPRFCSSEMQIAPTSHFVIESDIFGRENDKEKLIGILCSECHDGTVIKVVTVVGTGGLGKTTLAQLAYNSVKQKFDKFGWICVSQDFNVERLTKEAIELITGDSCGLTNPSALQNEISKHIRGKRVLLVLDDVWNENRSHWKSFQDHFLLAKEVVILVTTRNDSVAKIMQTIPTFNLGYMSKQHCWQLFQHYAFGASNSNQDLKFVEMGKQILEKCGMLPLAIKSVASLLRHEAQEKSWREILESELWESDASNEIFPSLQISYVHLPINLKPCFLYCSMFPKGYIYNIRRLVQLWISQGYIVSNGKKSAEKIGEEYAEQLRQRSFFEHDYYHEGLKLHDTIHDLAQSKLENRCYSIETGNDPDSSKKTYHLYATGGLKLFNSLCSINFDALRTLIFIERFYGEGEDVVCDLIISKAHKLRALELNWKNHSSFEFDNILKHLRYISLKSMPLPKYLCSLYLLHNLTLQSCDFKELPESIENLVSLEELIIEECRSLRKLPNEIGSLTNIQALEICETGVNFLPSSVNKIKGTLQVRLKCVAIGWLKDFVNFKGTLILEKLRNIVNFAEAQCAIVGSLHNLKCLELLWEEHIYIYRHKRNRFVCDNSAIFYEESNQLQLDLSGCKNPILYDKDYYLPMVILQPHPNLRELHINGYPCVTFPEWIENSTACASLERIVIEDCQKIAFLSFGSLCKLRYLWIYGCSGLQLLRVDSLPLQLQELEISSCDTLISVPGVQKLRSLVKLAIRNCHNLQWILMDVEPARKLTLCTYQSSLFGLNNLISLRNLRIKGCSKLQALIEEPRPVNSCEIKISNCPGMKKWCVHHNIFYKDTGRSMLMLPYLNYGSWDDINGNNDDTEMQSNASEHLPPHTPFSFL